MIDLPTLIPLNETEEAIVVSQVAKHQSCEPATLYTLLQQGYRLACKHGAQLVLQDMQMYLETNMNDALDVFTELYGYQYHVYCDGAYYKGAPRFFQAQRILEHLARVLDAPKILCTKDSRGVIVETWTADGKGGYRGWKAKGF